MIKPFSSPMQALGKMSFCNYTTVWYVIQPEVITFRPFRNGHPVKTIGTAIVRTNVLTSLLWRRGIESGKQVSGKVFCGSAEDVVRSPQAPYSGLRGRSSDGVVISWGAVKAADTLQQLLVTINEGRLPLRAGIESLRS